MSAEEKTRYTDAELEEFRLLIEDKLAKAQREYDTFLTQLTGGDQRDKEETLRPFNDVFDESSENSHRAEAQQQMARQKQFIDKLRSALVRIENKTYGVCRVTGKLIPKDRLRAVPHATLSIEAKQK